MPMDYFDIEEACYNDNLELSKRILETNLFTTTDNMLFSLTETPFYLLAISNTRYWFESEKYMFVPEPIKFETVFESISKDLKGKLIFHLDLFFTDSFEVEKSEGFWMR